MTGMTGTTEPAPEGGGDSLALKAQIKIEDLHGLILLILPPPGSGRAHTFLRLLSPVPFEQKLEDPAAIYSAEIGARLMRMVGAPQSSMVRWQGLMELHLSSILSDPARYAAYFHSGMVLVISGVTSLSERLDEVPRELAGDIARSLQAVGILHREFLERIGLDPLATPFQWAFERIHGDAPASAAEAGAVPRRRITLSSSPVKGVAANEIGVGAVIAPESDRTRHYRVVSVAEGSEKGTILFYVDPVGEGVPGYFTALALERIERAEGDESSFLPSSLSGPRPPEEGSPVELHLERFFFFFFLTALVVFLLILADAFLR